MAVESTWESLLGADFLCSTEPAHPGAGMVTSPLEKEEVDTVENAAQERELKFGKIDSKCILVK